MSIPGYCDTCEHRDYQHGDRALGGICAHGDYPRTPCNCTGYTNEGDASGDQQPPPLRNPAA